MDHQNIVIPTHRTHHPGNALCIDAVRRRLSKTRRRANHHQIGRYLLGTAIARPFIADALVEMAGKVGADAICHGATGKGDDILRFEQRIGILAPRMEIIAPWREWGFSGREDALELVRGTGVLIPDKRFDFSVDANLWHTSYEGGELEELADPIPKVISDHDRLIEKNHHQKYLSS